jgi:hypothetical protein
MPAIHFFLKKNSAIHGAYRFVQTPVPSVNEVDQRSNGHCYMLVCFNMVGPQKICTIFMLDKNVVRTVFACLISYTFSVNEQCFSLIANQ